MGFLVSKILPILGVTVFIVILCVIWTFVGIKNDRERDFNNERCEFKCDSCGNRSVCNKEGKK